jgi:hypothetical protein
MAGAGHHDQFRARPSERRLAEPPGQEDRLRGDLRNHGLAQRREVRFMHAGLPEGRGVHRTPTGPTRSDRPFAYAVFSVSASEAEPTSEMRLTPRSLRPACVNRSTPSLDCDLCVAARRRATDRSYHLLDGALNARPTRSKQHYQRELPGAKVLLILEVLVSGDKYRKARNLSGGDEFTILQTRPAAFLRSFNRVLDQNSPQRNGSALVKQNLHYAAAKELRAACSSTTLAC